VLFLYQVSKTTATIASMSDRKGLDSKSATLVPIREIVADETGEKIPTLTEEGTSSQETAVEVLKGKRLALLIEVETTVMRMTKINNNRKILRSSMTRIL
jgi:hypothetical protein